MDKSQYIEIEINGYWITFVLLTIVIFAMSHRAYLTKNYTGNFLDRSNTPYIGGAVGGTLRTIMTSQEQFRSQSIVDEDEDGEGEFGLLEELAGAPLRNGRPGVNPTFVTPILAPGEKDNFAAKSGFYYRSFVPDDPEMAELRYAVLAWPVARGTTGHNTYLLTPDKIYVWASPERSFDGEDAPELADIFFAEPWESPINTFDWRVGEGY